MSPGRKPSCSRRSWKNRRPGRGPRKIAGSLLRRRGGRSAAPGGGTRCPGQAQGGAAGRARPAAGCGEGGAAGRPAAAGAGEQVKAHQDTADPVISVDTKKKELVGDFKNAGRQWRPKGEPAATWPGRTVLALRSSTSARPQAHQPAVPSRSQVSLPARRWHAGRSHDPAMPCCGWLSGPAEGRVPARWGFPSLSPGPIRERPGNR